MKDWNDRLPGMDAMVSVIQRSDRPSFVTDLIPKMKKIKIKKIQKIGKKKYNARKRTERVGHSKSDTVAANGTDKSKVKDTTIGVKRSREKWTVIF